MSQPAVTALAPLPFELVYEDEDLLESPWHYAQMDLLLDTIYQAKVERGRTDFYVGGNMFVYYSMKQAEDIAAGRPYFRGPDVFYVGGVEGHTRSRKAWVSWEEGGRLPDLIVELVSPSTARVDRKVKRDLYSRVFKTPEYFLFEPDVWRFEGLRLTGDVYKPILPNSRGRLWSEVLGLELGLWKGAYKREPETTWVRLFQPDGRMIPTPVEDAEAELARLRAQSGDR
jgi:Uma2 family endonuclease